MTSLVKIFDMAKENDATNTIPLVSVVVPVFNGENYLEECLQSILNQTYLNFEVIVVDDGSNNPSEIHQIVLKLNDKRINYIRKENGGVASALNLGINHSKGQYFTWLSHDDKWHPRKLETQLRISFLTRELTLIFTNYDLIDQKSHFINRTNFQDKYEIRTILDGLAFGLLNGSSVLGPMEIFKKFKFDENLLYTQDYDLWLKFHKNNIKVKFCEESLIQYRVHNQQGSQLVNTRMKDEIDILWQSISTEYIQDLERNDFNLGSKLRTSNSYLEFLQKSNLETAADTLRIYILKLIENLKVSIIVLYRSRPFMIHRALESILIQDHSNYEIIVVHDTANNLLHGNFLKEIDSRYPRANIRVIQSFGIGIGESRNLSLNYVKGQYISFLDSDDYFLPHRLSSSLIEMVSHNADISIMRHITINEHSGQVLEVTNSHLTNQNLAEKLIDNDTSALSCLTVNSNLISNLISPFGRNLDIKEDLHFKLKLLEIISDDKYINIEKVGCVVRINSHSHRINVESISSDSDSLNIELKHIINKKRLVKNYVYEFFYVIFRLLGKPDKILKTQLIQKIRNLLLR